MTALLCLVLAAQPDPEFQSYRAHIEAAQSALAAADSPRARAWLDSAPRKHRGWEWNHLMAETDSSTGSFQASGSALTKLQVSPDGTTLATAAADGTVTLWDTRLLTKTRELKGHTGPVFGLSYSSDGALIVTTSRDSTIRLWGARTGEALGRLGDHPVTPYSAAFAPDGKRVVSVGWRFHPETKGPVGLVRVWDVATKSLLHTQDYTTHPVSSLAFSADGATCYLGCWEYQVGVMDMTTYRVGREIIPKRSSTYKAVDWVEVQPGTPTLVTANKDKTAKFFDADTGEELDSVPHGGVVTSARFTADGKWLVTGSQDTSLRLIDASSRKMVARLLGQGNPVTCVAVACDGSRAYSGDATGKVVVWDIASPNAFRPTYTVDGAWSCVFSPDGTKLAAGVNARTVQVRGSRAFDLLGSTPVFGSLVVDVAWSPDGTRLAAGSNDGTLRAFAVDGYRELWKVQAKGQVRSTDWSRDGRFVVGGDGKTGLVYVRRFDGSRLWERVASPGTVNVAFSPDSQNLAVASGREVQVFSLPDGARVARWQTLSSDAVDLAYAPDGATVAVGELGGHVEVFSSTGALHWSRKTTGSQWGVAYSPDGKRLATTGYDFAVHLWEPRAGLEVFALRGLEDQGFDIRFSPDGHRLAYMGGAGTTTVIDRRKFRDQGNNLL